MGGGFEVGFGRHVECRCLIFLLSEHSISSNVAHVPLRYGAYPYDVEKSCECCLQRIWKVVQSRLPSTIRYLFCRVQIVTFDETH